MIARQPPVQSQSIQSGRPALRLCVPPSIMVTRYPTDIACRDTQVEAEVELVQKIVSVVRSSRADYNIPNKSKTSLHLQIFCPSTSATIAQYTR